MNKTALKILICFTVISAVIATILLGINALGLAIVASDRPTHLNNQSPHATLRKISESIEKTGQGFTLSDSPLLPDNNWCILIAEDGNVVWSQNKPSDIPEHYTINDIARMTRWYISDYPVYVRTTDYGLLVLGIPKNAVGKYSIDYSMEWFDSLPQRLLAILVLNLCLAFLLAFFAGTFLYKRITALTHGINDLRREKPVDLPEKGLFKELSRNINSASAVLVRKNAILAVRDDARSNWISGISHDIRTPLSIAIGNSEALENSAQLPEDERKKAKIITEQCLKIKQLIEDLNLISSLEYDMQPTRKSETPLCPFIRNTISEIINSGLTDGCEIELNLSDEKTVVLIDTGLIKRAVYNLINNSVLHNNHHCKIEISCFKEGKNARLIIRDNGTGVPDDVIEKIDKIPKSAHGLGLPMAYKIISVHGGEMSVRNENGFAAYIKLPCL